VLWVGNDERSDCVAGLGVLWVGNDERSDCVAGLGAVCQCRCWSTAQLYLFSELSAIEWWCRGWCVWS